MPTDSIVEPASHYDDEVVFALAWDSGILCTTLGYTKTEAIDRTLELYDKHIPMHNAGYCPEWPRDKKYNFLKRRGIKMVKCLLRVIC